MIEDGTCDVLNHALYTDIEQFIDWINKYPSSVAVQKISKQTCGASSLIVNSKVASEGLFPWTAAIFRMMSEKYKCKGSGSLIQINML